MTNDIARARGRRSIAKAIQNGSSRSSYNDIRAKYPSNRVITESYLRLELPAQNSNVLSFKILENEGNAALSEKRLNIADDFVVTHVGFVNFSTDTTDGNAGLFLPEAFPNLVTLAGVDDASFLNTVYNGFMSIRKNSQVYFDAIEMSNFLKVGQAQRAASQGTGSTVYSASEWNANTPYKAIVPLLTLSGKEKTDLTITRPSSVSYVGLSCRVAVLLRGFLVQGATSK
jgi:hypothetical protein